MSDPRFYDFDAAFAERQPIPFRLLGRDWQLPPSCPAQVILRVQRLMLVIAQIENGQADDLPDDFVVDENLSHEAMCRQMVGDSIVEEWLALGISYDMLLAVTQRLYAIYTGQEPDDGPKVKPGKRPADRKKKASARAKS